MKYRRFLVFITALCGLAASISVFFYFQYSQRLIEVDIHNESRRDAELMAAKLDLFLAARKRAVKTLAGLPELHSFLELGGDKLEDEGRYLLDLVCTTEKASLCYVLDGEGTTRIHNSDLGGILMKGKNYGFRPYFQEAVKHGSAIYAAYGVTTHKRGVYFSHMLEANFQILAGVAVLKLPADFLDAELRSGQPGMMLLDPNGVIFAANEPEHILKSLWPLSESQQKQLIESRQFGDGRIEAIGLTHSENHNHLLFEGREYVLEGVELEELNGWQVAYLRQAYAPEFFVLGRTVTVAVALVALLVSLVVLVLYMQSRRSDRLRASMRTELENSEARLRQLSEISNEGIVLHTQGKILDVNGVSERLFGYTREQLLNKEVWDLLAPESIPIGFHNVHAGLELPYEVTAVRADGSQFPMEIYAKNSYINGKHVRVACLRDITALKQQEATIRYQAEFDQLTDLPNKQLFVARLQRALARAQESKTQLAVLHIDLDDFKKINDSLGHSVGDRLLVETARRLATVTRLGDTLARYGADEFVMLVDEVCTESGLLPVVHRVLTELGREFDIEGHHFYISGTTGIAVYPADGEDGETLVRNADIAMHRCKKEHGGNSYQFYQASMNEDVSGRVEMERYLRRAVHRRELLLHYQPIVATESRELLGAEVLVRWQSAELGLVGPDRFIPLAEQTGLIVEIGQWILRNACEQGKLWHDQTGTPFYLAVNVSPRQLRQEGFVAMLTRTLEETGFPAEYLVIELTEGLLVAQDVGTAQLLDELKALGVMLSMDDFGTGYSSLAYLKMFPFDAIKIDRSFVRDLAVDTSDQQLVVAAIEMARALGLKVVAEGVETIQQLHFLHEAGCYSVQGYFLGRPVPAERFEAHFLPSHATKTVN